MAGRKSHSGPDLGRLLRGTADTETDPALLAPEGAPGQPAASSWPWAQVEPHESAAPFTPGRMTVRARVSGGAMQAFDVDDGDDLILVRRPVAEHGDLAVLPLGAVRFPYGAPARAAWHRASPDTLTLWKVYPEAGRLRLSMGGGDRDHDSGLITAPVDAPIHGVVVGVLRRPTSE